MKVKLRHKSKHKKILRIVIVSVVFIIIGMLLPRLFSAVSAIFMYPVHVTNSWLEESSDFIPTLIRDKKSLHEQIEILENDLIAANRSDLTQRRLIEENNRLRESLGISDKARVAAAVIARPDELPYDLLQIDRGRNHGITIGSPVFVGKDVVIGLVVHTTGDYSFVELLTTPGFEATTFIQGPNITAKMEGVGGGIARVSVPQGVVLKVGNLVYLPTVEPGVFGRISYIESSPTQPEQYGYIAPDIPLSSLHFVSVGTQSQISKSIDEIDEVILERLKSELVVTGIGTTTASTTIVSENEDN